MENLVKSIQALQRRLLAADIPSVVIGGVARVRASFQLSGRTGADLSHSLRAIERHDEGRVQGAGLGRDDGVCALVSGLAS